MATPQGSDFASRSFVVCARAQEAAMGGEPKLLEEHMGPREIDRPAPHIPLPVEPPGSPVADCAQGTTARL